MEQLEQLIGIRDAAEARLEAARAAIERSPDAKLVASLTLLIDDLRKSFETEGAAAADTEPPAPASDAAQQGSEESAEPEASAAEAEAPEAGVSADAANGAQAGTAEPEEPAAEEAAPAAEEFSLEDSLEAELLAVDGNPPKP